MKYGDDKIRYLKCIDNEGEENRLTIGKEYISGNDFLWDKYVIEEVDNGAKKQLIDKKYFEEI